VLRLLGVLAIVLGLTACENSSDEKYRDGFPPIDRGVTALGTDVGEAVREAGQSEDLALARQFGGFARRIAGLNERLEALDPPGQLEGDHKRTLTAMAAVRAALADVAAAARRGDAAAASEAATRLVRSGARLDQARARLARAVRGL
jgi:hypothetical protein